MWYKNHNLSSVIKLGKILRRFSRLLYEKSSAISALACQPLEKKYVTLNHFLPKINKFYFVEKY